ncbi:hypothetical protein ORG27_12310 [Stenotrophomonas lactitubi]|uniref:hypothetical protein n=1 Tax=Stenotrophomonas lactitubi TaxID=2045214 RepID=UPI002249473E|nr:hypothetical protein [Stenotrophomonas lactitubi]MCX2894360.1 hypothetical protein [Stenotrophomonas lactitubi]
MDKTTIFKAVLAWILSGLVLYGIGSFVAASFDIATWNADGRFAVSLLWVGASIALSALFCLPRWP